MTVRDWLAVAALALSLLCWTGIGLVFYFITWPFMRDTRKAAVDGLELAIKNAKAMGVLGELLEQAREILRPYTGPQSKITAERLERILVGLERATAAAADPFKGTGDQTIPRPPLRAPAVGAVIHRAGEFGEVIP